MPHTGTVAIAHALKAGAVEVRAFGFDFHTSMVYADTGKATGQKRILWERQRQGGRRRTHHPDKDQEFLATLAQTDSRFRPDPHMAGVLGIAAVPLNGTAAANGADPSDPLGYFVALVTRWRQEGATLQRYAMDSGERFCRMHANDLDQAIRSARKKAE
jgi:hypothetical protein